MKAIFNFFAYIWTLLRSCFAYPLRSGQSYARLQELSEYKINFASEGFYQLVRRARSEFKLIIVYLHSENHQDTDLFWEDILQNDVFAEFINSREFIFKLMDIQTTEGYQMSQKLQVTTYPFLGVLLSSSSTPQLVARIEGVTQLESILETLQTTYDRYHPVLVTERYDATERDLARQQREDQDKAYQEALEEDKRREEERQQEELRLRAEEEQRVREEQERDAKRINISDMRKELLSKFFNENGDSLEPTKSSETCLIRFKFPNGSMLQRNFLKTDSVNLLYELVFALRAPFSSWEPSEDTTIDNITLSTTYPKRILSRDRTILEEKCANETLLVHEDV